MAGPSAKQIPYGMDGIHMELASIPPGIRLECGGTVKTLQIIENAEERRVEIENEVELMGSSTNFVESSGALGRKQTDGRPNQQLLPKKN